MCCFAKVLDMFLMWLGVDVHACTPHVKNMFKTLGKHNILKTRNNRVEMCCFPKVLDMCLMWLGVDVHACMSDVKNIIKTM